MQQNTIKGFFLALLAAMMWGSLPIAAAQVLRIMNAQTLVWYRFLVAAIGLMIILALRHKLPQKSSFSAKSCALIALGVVGLSANFFLFSHALNYVSPTTNQVLWLLAPFTMMICGVLLFKEPFALHQKIGIALLVIGLVAFFNDKFGEILQLNTYALGVLFSASAGFVWVLYGIAQKLMLRTFSSQQILLIIYTGCMFALLPFAQWDLVTDVIAEPVIFSFFIYCCINTLIGYGAFAEALNNWDAAKVSVVTTLLPIFTMIFSLLGHWLFPERFADPDMNTLSYIGAFVVVFGAIFSVIGYKFLKQKL